MSLRASIRRIEKVENNLLGRGRTVVNLCGRHFRLLDMHATIGNVERCYARNLGNCRPPISREHFISEAILDQFEGGIPADGVPWLKGRMERIPTNALAANILCTYHNSFLSPLDDLAGRLFANLRLLSDGNSPSVLVWGPSFERWLLKVLIGLIAAGQADAERRTEAQEVPEEWIEILFGLREFPPEQGLYMTPVVGRPIQFHDGFAMSTLTLGGELRGIRANLAGIEFYLSMAPKTEAFAVNHPNYETILYRPRGLDLDGVSPRIGIYWD